MKSGWTKCLLISALAVVFFAGFAPRAESQAIAGSYIAYGDSITACFVVGTTGCYPFLLAPQILGSPTAIPTLFAYSGDQGCDATNVIFNRSSRALGSTELDTLMISTNDAWVKGPGSYEAVFNTCQQAAISWLSVPLQNKRTAANFCPQPAGWSQDKTYSEVIGLSSTTNGASITWPSLTTPANGVIYIWYRIIDGNGGQFSYTVDGGAPSYALNTTIPSIATQNGGTQSVALLRITGLSAGAHTVVTKVVSATGAGNVVSILGIATPQVAATLLPVYVSGTPYQLNDQDSIATATYNTDIQNNILLLQSDGLNPVFVNVRAYNHGTPPEMFDQYHPNIPLGHMELFEAFYAAITGN
jgi:hypothetical protein